MDILLDNAPLNLDDLGKEMPVLALKNMLFFPGIATPINIARSKSLKLIDDIQQGKSWIGVFCQKDTQTDDPDFDDLFPVGLVANILNVQQEENDTITVLVIAAERVKLESITATEPYLKGTFSLLPTIEDNTPETQTEIQQLRDIIKEKTLKILASKIVMPDFVIASLQRSNDYNYLSNLALTSVDADIEKKQAVLACNHLKDRYTMLLSLLDHDYQLVEIKESIRKKTQVDIDKQQREYFLQQEMKNIQEALGGNIHDIDLKDIKEKAAKISFTPEQRKTFDKELKMLEHLHPHSPDYSTQMTYIQNILSLPWNNYTQDNFNLNKAKQILDKEHFGMEKVKERILEHLAVLKLKGDMKAPILCLYGPPGVGKTSLGKSVADAINRKYIRMSLGGLHDEAEIRGHRRTYIAAMPGRIIQSIQKAGSANPVIILDEIDKVNHSHQGDPAAALLEVLDPEQNFAFHDNYLDMDFDLSKILFIATANSLNNISQPLLDRMELINISGYIMEEKLKIAAKHLLPTQMDRHGVAKKQFDIPKKTMEAIIESYTRESGVRELNKKLATIMRKIARAIAAETDYPKKLQVSDLKEFLGAVEYTKERYEGNEYAGVVTGLAWTAVGGEILLIEVSLSKGKDPKLTLTGNLGDVMKESAVLSLEYIKSHATQWNIPDEVFSKWNVHIHVPEGAIPKDGPSAGITMTTALVSAFTQRKVKPLIAMTGEMTLRGRVLPVGGIKEKILAAKRAGIKEIILSHENKRNIEEINEIYLQGLQFHYVKDISEVLNIALLPEKVEGAVEIV
ncbi:MAG: endopeptidase La [Candidatus Symbiothrix sp.]|jgi:ATP-dependent Lon protease|nr:endopeptidase La [Candidatus Symbiothrix sp.]